MEREESTDSFLSRPSTLVVSPQGCNSAGRNSSGQQRRVRFVDALEAWEDRHDVNDLCDLEQSLLVPFDADSSESGTRIFGASSSSSSSSPSSSSQSLQLNRRAQVDKKPRRSLPLLVSLFVVGIFCVTGARLSEIGFFSGDKNDASFPMVSNGTAKDRATGVSFQMHYVPPGMDSEFDLFGMTVKTGHNGTRLSVVGLYLENRTEDIPTWKKLISERNFDQLFHEIVNGYHPMSLRVVLLKDQMGGHVARHWLKEFETSLKKQHPFNHEAVVDEQDEFLSWFPDKMLAEDVIWLSWDHRSTTFSVNGAITTLSGDQHIGRAIFENELHQRGTSLVNLLYHFF